MSKLEVDAIEPQSGTTLTIGASGDTVTIPSGAGITLTDGVSGDFKMNSGYGSVATAYGCRAWIQFDGTGSFTINGSGNISSITDNGVGKYKLNFTTAMPDANYVAVASAQSEVTRSLNTSTASYAEIQTEGDDFNQEDSSKVDVAVFR